MAKKLEDDDWVEWRSNQNRKKNQTNEWKEAQKQGIKKKYNDPKFLEEDRKRKLEVMKKRNQGEEVKNRLGIVVTLLGEFDCVRHAWQAQCEKDPDTIKNPHNWFKKMCKEYPNDYYKKNP
jgi:hypothetical protein